MTGTFNPISDFAHCVCGSLINFFTQADNLANKQDLFDFLTKDRFFCKHKTSVAMINCKLFTTSGWGDAPLYSFEAHVALLDAMGEVMTDMMQGFSAFDNLSWGVALDPSGTDFGACCGSLTRAYFFIKLDVPFNGTFEPLFDGKENIPLLIRSYIGSTRQADDLLVFKQ